MSSSNEVEFKNSHKYLKEGERIDENTFYLNRLGKWIPSRAIGATVKYSEYGRYIKPNYFR